MFLYLLRIFLPDSDWMDKSHITPYNHANCYNWMEALDGITGTNTYF